MATLNTPASLWQILAESPPAETVPTARAPNVPPDILQSVSPNQSGQVPQPSARVLVIDDDPSLRTVLFLVLEDLFQVVTAATGGEGLTRLQHDPISIVLLDLHLPDLDGFEVLQRIRALDPQITVFILTGDPDPTIGARAKLLGAVGVLPKPWDIDALRTQLWQTWEHTNRARPATAQIDLQKMPVTFSSWRHAIWMLSVGW